MKKAKKQEKMKKKFSVAWKGSKKIRKQRKYRFEAPLHIKYNFLASHLSKELRKKYNKRSLPLRKGDTVKIMRGEFRKKEGKIAIVNTKKNIVFIEGMQKARKDGTKVNIPFSPSKLQIINLNLDDKKRLKLVERKGIREEKTKEKK